MVRCVRRLAAGVVAPAALALAGCVRDPQTAIEARGEAVSYVLAEQVERGVGTSINLADLAPFRWERLYVFGPGTPVGTVRDSVRVAWPGLEHFGRAAISDSANLLVFVGGGQVLGAVLHPRSRGDFAAARAGRGYAPAEALFRVDSVGSGVGRRVLR